MSLFLSSQQKVLLHFSKHNLIKQGNEDDTSSDEDIGHSYRAVVPKQVIEGVMLQKDFKEIEIETQHADNIISDSLSSLFLNRELSTVNKKILFGTLTKQPEKLLDSDDTDNSRTLAAIGVGATNNRTPVF